MFRIIRQLLLATALALMGLSPALVQPRPAGAMPTVTCTNGGTAITDMAGLQAINNNRSGTYCLVNDLNASGVSNFTPIGGSSSTSFTGAFDGQGHTISNLAISGSPGHSGLFGYVGSGGTVKNVGLVNTSATGDFAGGLAGENAGSISSSYSNGSITPKSGYAGGLVGRNDGSVTNSYSTGSVSAGAGGYRGGLVGYNLGVITSSYSATSLAGSGTAVGGLVGDFFNGTITNSYWDKDTSGQPNGIGTRDYGTGTPTGLTDTAMRQQSSFTGFTFTLDTAIPPANWSISNGVTYPYLQWQAPVLAVTTNLAGTPPTATAGTAFNVTVTALNVDATTDTGYTGTVHLSLRTPDSGATGLDDYTFTGSESGTHTFSVTLTKGPGQVITAIGTGTSTAIGTSGLITVSPVTPDHLAFGTQPSNKVAGAAITPAVTVRVEDSYGNLTTSTAAITMAITDGTGTSGATLGGTTTVNAVNGVATFSDLSIQKAGTGYTLTASTTGLASSNSVTSTAFNITVGPATKLTFDQQPSDTGAGGTITPAVTVRIEDSYGNLTTSAATVALAITSGTGTSGAALSGTTSKAAVSGVATFSDLKINTAGTGYTLDATSTGIATATSTQFNITTGTASKLVFTVQPSTTTAGATITPSVKVAIEDSAGNVITSDTSSVTLALHNSSETLHGTVTRAAVNGVATFDDLSITRAGNYSLDATDGSLTSATSTSFDITHAVADHLIFSTQPVDTVAGQTIGGTSGVVVQVVDQHGNLITDGTHSSASIAMAITSGTGAAGATLLGTTPVTASGGVATFSDLTINTAGTGYTLTASTSGLTTNSVDSSAFNITPATASKLAFGNQPSTTVAGGTISGGIGGVTVEIQDQYGNLTNSTADVSVALHGSNQPTLYGTKTVAASGGVASFSDLSIQQSGTGYQLDASSAGLTGDTSNTFDVQAGEPSKLAFGTQPSDTTAGQSISPAVTVRFEDSYGNLTPKITDNVTVALHGTGQPALGGTTTVAAVSGVATFNDLSVQQAGSYSLDASSKILTGATSTSFTITAASAAKLTFGQQPTGATVGGTITPPVTVRIEDQYGNLTSSSASVGLAITGGTGTSGAILSGGGAVSAVNGVATFSNLSVDKAGTGYTLDASSTGLTTATSTSFTITAAADTAPPTTITALDGTSGTNEWYTSPVTLTLTVSDPQATSGFTTYYRSSSNGGRNWTAWTTSTANPVVLSFNSDGQYTVQYYSKDAAGNTEGTQSISFKIDQTDPTVSITTPTAAPTTGLLSPTYLKGVKVAAKFSCSDVLSGIQSCTATVDGNTITSGNLLPTSVMGGHSVVVTAVDKAGNQTVKTVTYTVGYKIGAQYSTGKTYPLAGPIPIAIQLLDSGNANLSVSSLTVTAVRVVNAHGDIVQTLPLNSSSNFTFVPQSGKTGAMFTFNLTPTSLPAGSYNLVFTVSDSTAVEYVAPFKIK